VDWGKFKTPTLRDVTKTAPYMHDGSLKTLEEIVDFYDKGGTPNKDLDEKIKKLNLTPEQKKGLVEFLKALDGAPISLAVPTSFPQ
jgi:cytochrome c peroxidase